VHLQAGMKQAIRAMWRNRTLTITIVISLALGIAGNAAIFTIVNALFLQPAGIRDPAKVVAPRVTYKKLHLDRIEMSVPDFAAVRDDRKIFAAAALGNATAYNYTGAGTPERLQGEMVTFEWFDVLGARPLIGRTFTAQEDAPGANHVIILSDALWTHLFGRDKSAIGKAIELDHQPYRVVGVMRPEANWPREAQFWIPFALPKTAYSVNETFNEFYTAIARLQPNVTYDQCEREMAVLSARIRAGDPKIAAYAAASQWSMVVEPITQLTSGNLKTPLVVLSASIALVLLIACSNIAGLILVRGTARVREFAVRRALGARTADIVRHSTAEVALLCLLGTGLGLLLVPSLLNGLLSIAPKTITEGLLIVPDYHVLVFTILLGSIAAIALGIFPALQLSRYGVSYESLKEGGRSSTVSSTRQRARSALVAAQIALALLLLMATSLLFKSLNALRSENLGFEPAHVFSATVDLPSTLYGTDAKQIELYRSVMNELEATPGVIGASATRLVPFDGQHWTGSFDIEGRPEGNPGDPGPHSYKAYVGPAYFRTLQIPIIRGRSFTDEDRKGSAPVAIIDTNLAKRYWPRQDPIGKRLRDSNSQPWATIVGVVGHTRTYSFAQSDTRGIFYSPVYQKPFSQMSFIVRTASKHGDMIQQAVHRADPTLAVFEFAPLQERIAGTLGPQEFAVTLLMGFASVAMALTAMGLYGVISFSALGRTREIGVRAALGATRGQIVGLLARQGVQLIAIGLAVGAVLSVLALRVLATRVESLNVDPTIGLLDAAGVGAIGIVAILLPAWRASRSDAALILRNE